MQCGKLRLTQDTGKDRIVSATPSGYRATGHYRIRSNCRERSNLTTILYNTSFILDNIGAADKRLVWLDHSYHVATLDNDKELIASETLRFIQQHS